MLGVLFLCYNIRQVIIMPKGVYKNFAGQKFNKLLILEELKKGSRIYCKCKCDCGNIKLIRKCDVVSGIVKSCGCLKSLVGRRFGKLIVLEETKQRTKSGKKVYKCRCDCGNIKMIGSDSLSSGTKSCGCLSHQPEYDNLIGKRFGKLVVVKKVKNSERGQCQFLCHCDCGNNKVILGCNLIYGESTSCGCNKGYIDNTKLNLIARQEAYPNSQSGIKGVWQDKKGYWHSIITVQKKRILFYGGAGDEGKEKCIKWRQEMVEKYHKPILDKYSMTK